MLEKGRHLAAQRVADVGEGSRCCCAGHLAVGGAGDHFSAARHSRRRWEETGRRRRVRASRHWFAVGMGGGGGTERVEASVCLHYAPRVYRPCPAGRGTGSLVSRFGGSCFRGEGAGCSRVRTPSPPFFSFLLMWPQGVFVFSRAKWKFWRGRRGNTLSTAIAPPSGPF